MLVRRLEEHALTVNLSKRIFCKKQIPFLGHIISAEGIQPSSEKLFKIQNITAPRNIRELSQLIGKFLSKNCNWIRNFKWVVEKGQKV